MPATRREPHPPFFAFSARWPSSLPLLPPLLVAARSVLSPVVDLLIRASPEEFLISASTRHLRTSETCGGRLRKNKITKAALTSFRVLLVFCRDRNSADWFGLDRVTGLFHSQCGCFDLRFVYTTENNSFRVPILSSSNSSCLRIVQGALF